MRYQYFDILVLSSVLTNQVQLKEVKQEMLLFHVQVSPYHFGGTIVLVLLFFE